MAFCCSSAISEHRLNRRSTSIAKPVSWHSIDPRRLTSEHRTYRHRVLSCVVDHLYLSIRLCLCGLFFAAYRANSCVVRFAFSCVVHFVWDFLTIVIRILLKVFLSEFEQMAEYCLDKVNDVFQIFDFTILKLITFLIELHAYYPINRFEGPNLNFKVTILIGKQQIVAIESTYKFHHC